MTSADLSDAELLIREGIEAAQAGDRARARDLLSLAVALDRDSAQGWLWLSRVVEHPEDQESCLRRVLALEPGNELARGALAGLQEQKQQREERLLSSLREATWQESARAPQRVAAEGLRPEPVEGLRPEPAEGLRPEPAEGLRAEPVEEPRAEPVEGARLVIGNEFVLLAGLGLLLLALIVWADVAGAEALPAPLSLLRLLLGLAFVLFVPGYALQAALFPRSGGPSTPSGQGLDGAERLALSFGLSVAVVPPLALILDWLPWGIRLWPIVIGEGLVIVLLSAVALVRRGRLPAGERPVLAVNLGLKGWWADQDRTGRVLYAVVAGALLLAVVSAAAIILQPKPGEQFTEFYVLGPEGLAESYPREAAPGEALSVTAGIANREGQVSEYRIEVRLGGELIGAAGPVTLGDGEIWEAPVTYALPRAGEDQEVEFLLYRDGGLEPYRSLRLWIDVVETPAGGGE